MSGSNERSFPPICGINEAVILCQSKAAILDDKRQTAGTDSNIPSPATTRHLRAFSGVAETRTSTAVQGNSCLIHLAEARPEDPPAPAAVTQCVTWAERPGYAGVRCWTPSGSEIQLCGHGLLCSGHYWLDHWGTGTVLEMGGVEVPVEHKEGLDWVSFPTIETRDSRTPEWVAELLGQAPERTAEAGPVDGYLVVQMAPDCDIASLPLPGPPLTSHTRRSLIVTREVTITESLCGETIQYRYFAPQHGVPEDTATGSAMRVLAAYWQRRGAGDELSALQRSAGGGWLLSRIERDRTWIGGRVVQDGRAVA